MARSDADSAYRLVDSSEPHPLGWQVRPVDDLRSALELLQQYPDEFIETDVEVDPHGQLAGVYRYVGAGGTVMRPTRIGPAMCFNTIKGYPDARILVGMMANRRRVSRPLGAPVDQLGKQMAEERKLVTPPVLVERDKAPCQEVVHRADDPGFDIRRLLPAPTNTLEDAGPCFCLGLVLGSDPEDRENIDVTIHRLCVQGPRELSIFFVPGRHIDFFRQKAEASGRPLPISINMGLDPAILIGSCFEAPTTPFGFDELCVAGSLRGKPVALTECLTVPQRAIARAEIAIEGEILPNVRVAEDQHTRTGKAMPESLGYTGEANPDLPVIRVTAATTRREPPAAPHELDQLLLRPHRPVALRDAGRGQDPLADRARGRLGCEPDRLQRARGTHGMAAERAAAQDQFAGRRPSGEGVRKRCRRVRGRGAEVGRAGTVLLRSRRSGQLAAQHVRLALQPARLVRQAVKVPSATGEEARRFYDWHQERFASERLVEVEHILLSARPDAAFAYGLAVGDARTLIRRIAADPSCFAALAREHSACPSKAQGGNLGQIGRGQTVPKFEQASLALEEGELCLEPVRSPFGVHVIRAGRRIEGRQLPFELVEGSIRNYLEEASYRRAMAQYLAILASETPVEGIDLPIADGPLVQ